MKGIHPNGKATFKAGAAIAAGEFVKFSSGKVVKAAAATDVCVGVALDAAAADGDNIPVQLLTSGDTALVKAGGEVSQGGTVTCLGTTVATAGTRGVWALGEGDVSAEVSVQDILYSYYAVGVMNSLCEKNVGIYWFGSTPFPIEETAQNVNRLFLHMAEKFEDEGLPYKIFLRANGFPSGGGTAVFRSYMLGYSNDGNDAPSGKSLIHLFAHEMVHNWPHIEDEPYGSGNWYAEGTAQFYCSMLPYRLGMTSIDELCREVQLNADYLYRNPTRDMPAMEAAKLFWTDRRTQRLPYGRGFIYLANVDAEVREATGGRECLDDLCRTVLRRQRKGEKIGNEEWIGVIAAYVGEERARREHTEMMDGTVIAPRADAFDGLLEVHEAEVTLDAMLTDEQSIGKAETSQEKAMGWIWTVKK